MRLFGIIEFLVITYYFHTNLDNPEMIDLNDMTDRVFQEMDSNRDKKVTKDEFVQACLSNKNISGMLAKKMLKIVSTDTI